MINKIGFCEDIISLKDTLIVSNSKKETLFKELISVFSKIETTDEEEDTKKRGGLAHIEGLSIYMGDGMGKNHKLIEKNFFPFKEGIIRIQTIGQKEYKNLGDRLSSTGVEKQAVVNPILSHDLVPKGVQYIEKESHVIEKGSMHEVDIVKDIPSQSNVEILRDENDIKQGQEGLKVLDSDEGQSNLTQEVWQYKKDTTLIKEPVPKDSSHEGKMNPIFEDKFMERKELVVGKEGFMPATQERNKVGTVLEPVFQKTGDDNYDSRPYHAINNILSNELKPEEVIINSEDEVFMAQYEVEEQDEIKISKPGEGVLDPNPGLEQAQVTNTTFIQDPIHGIKENGFESINVRETLQDVFREAEIAISQGRNQAEVRLEPEELGKVDIKVRIEEGKIEVMFSTERSDICMVIEGELARFREHMVTEGFDVGYVNVEVDSGSRERMPFEESSVFETGITEEQEEASFNEDRGIVNLLI